MASPREEPTPLSLRSELTRRAASEPLVLVLLAAAAGILLDRLAPCEFWVWGTLASLAWLGWLACWASGHWRQGRGVLLLAVLAVAGLSHHGQWYLFPRDLLARRADSAGQPVCFSGVAMGQPRRVPKPPIDLLRAIAQGEQSRFSVRATAVRQGDRWLPTGGEVQLLVEGDLSGVKAGDQLLIFGRLYAPEPAANPGEFDFAAHSRADRRLCLVRCSFPECVSVTQAGSWFDFQRGLDNVRVSADRVLWRRIQPTQSGLAAAVLLGAREQVDREMTLSFVKTGTIHLLAISGLHVGMLAMVLLLAARSGLLPRNLMLLSIIALILFYAALTDARPSVVRAAILVTLTCLGWMLHRQGFSANSLAAAALVVLAMNPADLFRVGTQLSFLAVATLCWLGPRLTRSTPQDSVERMIWQTMSWPERTLRSSGWVVWRLLAASAVVWLVTLPLVVLRFHVASFSGLVLNTLLWLPMALSLLCGFATLATDAVLPPLSALFGWCCQGNLSLIQQAVDLADSLPGSYVWTPAPPAWWVGGLYAGMGLTVVVPRRWPRSMYAVALLVWVAVGSAVGWIADAQDPVLQERQLRATFLSVGHGSAVVLELPGGQTLLYDAGKLGSPQAGTRTVADYLWSRGIRRIDAVVISHADVDHYNAVPGLVDRFAVSEVYVSPVMFQHQSPALEILRTSVTERGIPLREIYAGDRLRTAGPASLEVLHPPSAGVNGSDNANSLVLLVEFAGRRLLLPGDLETTGLASLLDELPIDCDGILAPHHGSGRSNPVEFTAWSSPEFVVISGGHSNVSPEVSAAFGSSGAVVLHTAEQGAIECSLSRSAVTLRTWNGRKGTWNESFRCPPPKEGLGLR